jgi:hypothetical protein
MRAIGWISPFGTGFFSAHAAADVRMKRERRGR